MHRSKNARLPPTALVSIAGLLLWAACSSKENDFFNTPPVAGAGHSGASGSAGNPSGGNAASGGASGTDAVGGSGGSSTPTGGKGGDASASGGNAASGGAQATGGSAALGGSGASGGSDSGGAGDGDGSGGVAEGGAPSGGTGGDTVASGGMSGSGGSSGSSGVAGTASGAGGSSGASGAGGMSGASGSGTGGVSGTGAAGGGGLAGTSGAGGAGSSNAGAGGTSSPVTCSDDNGCQASQFCAKSSCNGASGTCKAKPMECAGTDATFAPVCGCDHMTYYSPCVADREGINVASQGECTVTVSCTRTDGGKSCNPARALARCYRPRDSCSGTSPSTGVCWVMPDECPNESQVNRYCGGVSGTPSCVGLCEGLFNEYPVWRDSNQCQ